MPEIIYSHAKSNLGDYDAFIFLDETSALHPLHIKPDGRQIPETYPFGV